MKTYELKAASRKLTGDGPARVLRREGRIPAVVYGPGRPPESISILRTDLQDVLRRAGSEQFILNLSISNGSLVQRSAMLKELQVHPLSRRYLHADFYEIAMDRKISVHVPVVPVGKSKGVEKGGLLQVVRRELEVTSLPMDVPNCLEIDVTDMDIGDSIHLHDIGLPDNIELPGGVNFTVITVVAPKAVEAGVGEAEETEEEAPGSEG